MLHVSMTHQLSKYSCDHCRSRKTRCSRELSGCSTCALDSHVCKYSRSGVIRRNRQRKRQDPEQARSQQSGPDSRSTVAEEATSSLHPDIDDGTIETADERLGSLGGERFSSAPLPLLFTDSKSFWQDPEFIAMANRIKLSGNSQFFTFEQEAESWISFLGTAMERAKPMFTPIPTEILEKIPTTPELVSDNAYLVIFYGFMLTEASTNLNANIGSDLQLKLKWNLWYAMNDARLLLQPSELHIQALLLLAVHVDAFHTPSLCWMVSTTAFRMMQALGINTPGLNAETKRHRSNLFWFMNMMDKGLALVFGRPPIFTQTMCAAVPMPSIIQLQSFQPHMHDATHGESAFRSLFGAHFLYRAFLQTQIIAEVWDQVFGDATGHTPRIVVRKRLDTWFDETMTILKSTLLSEKPFLDHKAVRAMELGIQQMSFHYRWLVVALTKACRSSKADCVEASQKALSLLEGLVSGSEDVFNGVVWTLLYYPFTPFFVLFAHVLAETDYVLCQRYLEAMECLPLFLRVMTPRHPLAGKLYDTAANLFNRARTMHQQRFRQSGKHKRGDSTASAHPICADMQDLDFLTGFFPGATSTGAGGIHQGITELAESSGTSNEAQLSTNISQAPNAVVFEPKPQYDFMTNSMFDWFTWDAHNGD
ncbi:hypothetical protein F5Y15DRAFT_49996 [Xylariaceae sp. FL0016]|nr:hypothetical protein F5Y15DRAFT_49996 [Xylariaceae sp. FL0016]